MRTPRVLVAVALMSVSACAARPQKMGLVGQGTAFVQPRDAANDQDASAAHPPWAVGSGMQLARGSYELALWFDIPRAQTVEWTVTCPGVEVTGVAGESFERYKARRIEEQDIGAGRLASTVRVSTGGSGVCAVTATADDATVLGTYQVTRIRDLELEARARSTTQRAAAIQVTGRTPAMLVTYDPGRVERERAAERAAAEMRLAYEADARIRMQLDAERQTEIDAHRERLIIDDQQRRLDLAQRARTDLRRRWAAWGAIPRPPMPARVAEKPGEPPSHGASWTAGRWQWVDAEWTWRVGSWIVAEVLDGVGGTHHHKPDRDHDRQDHDRQDKNKDTAKPRTIDEPHFGRFSSHPRR